MRTFYLIFSFVCINIATVFAQQTKLFNVNFQRANIKQVVTELERQSNFLFYYDETQLDSIRITLSASEKNLSFILDETLNKIGFYYAIVGNRVFITKGNLIDPLLARNGVDSLNQSGVPLAILPANFLKEEVVDIKPIQSTSENKVYNIGIQTNNVTRENATVTGYLRDIKTAEPIVGASIYVPLSKTGITTNQFGYFTITLPKGPQLLEIKGMGMRDTKRQLMVYGDGKLDIDMQEQITTLREVKISAEKVANVRNLEMGVTKLDIKSIKQVPTVFGETDVLKVVLTLPGVQSVGESSANFNVRGGAADQNLILLNDATIYNPTHFFGFFSAFDPDLIKDVELYKSSIPERYGGRLASVLDVTNREGSRKKLTGSVGLGLLTSRFYLEGPIDTNSTSFIVGARTSYADWLLKSLQNKSYQNSSASFYDVNLDLSHKINDKNFLYLTSYISNDGFKLNGDTTYNYGNSNLILKWRHIFTNKLYGVLSGGYDYYKYSIAGNTTPANAYLFNFNIRQLNLRSDFNYYLNNKNTINIGLSSILYRLNPGSNNPVGAKSVVAPINIATERALESALYVGDKMDITEKLSVNLGIRLSMFNYLGPQTVNNYSPGFPTVPDHKTGSITYGSGQFIKTYSAPEIRTSLRYIITDNFSVKASYNTTRQYIHLLSNTTSISPTDVWKLSDNNIKPQYGDQLSLGLYKNFSSNTIETSVEVYYKRIKNYLDYRSGAQLVLNPAIENDVLPVRGKAYGLEFFVKKTTGKLNGWVSYTYSRILLQQNDVNAGELINGGNFYAANYDKPHSVNFIGNYRITHRYSASLNAVYSTGRPITVPISRFNYGGSDRVYYSDRNVYRIPDYFRLDFSATFEANHKLNQRFHNSWTFGVYNLTGRHNPYSTYFISESGRVNGYKLSIFASMIPFASYNIRF